MEVVKSYYLYLNTREANTGTSNNCTWRFTTPIVLTNTNNRFLISTPMVELPYSFSQVNTTNWNLPYTYVDTNGSGHSFSSTTMNIPEGNYNINQLQTQLTLGLLMLVNLLQILMVVLLVGVLEMVQILRVISKYMPITSR